MALVVKTNRKDGPIFSQDTAGGSLETVICPLIMTEHGQQEQEQEEEEEHEQYEEEEEGMCVPISVESS